MSTLDCISLLFIIPDTNRGPGRSRAGRREEGGEGGHWRFKHSMVRAVGRPHYTLDLAIVNGLFCYLFWDYNVGLCRFFFLYYLTHWSIKSRRHEVRVHLWRLIQRLWAVSLSFRKVWSNYIDCKPKIKSFVKTWKSARGDCSAVIPRLLPALPDFAVYIKLAYFNRAKALCTVTLFWHLVLLGILFKMHPRKLSIIIWIKHNYASPKICIWIPMTMLYTYM